MIRQKSGFVKNFLVLLAAALAFSACAPEPVKEMQISGLTPTTVAAFTATASKTKKPAAARTSTSTPNLRIVRKVVDIASGEGHSCAVISDGQVWCWGKNEYGQLGDGTTKDREEPVQVSGLDSAASVTAGWGHTCALTWEKKVKCWGYNKNGELGNGRENNSSIPVDVLGYQERAEFIAAGDDHTCAVLLDGTIRCWGFNETGQLGDGTNVSRSTPVQVGGLAGEATALAAGWGHTCALTDAGGVMCWGDDGFGQLGNNAYWISSYSPVKVEGLGQGVTAITAKGGYNCALLEGGAVKCWGSNDYGKLGDGTVENRPTPVPVSGLEGGVKEIAAGWRHACAVLEDGRMKCWGWNYYGQLGDRSMTLQLRPVSVTELPGPAASAGLGWRHTCAVIDPGLVMCWGDDQNGQVWKGWLVDPLFPTATPSKEPDGGRTATPTREAATPRPEDLQYQPMDSGGSHNCAVTGEGGVKCWGNNEVGQMGIGNTVTQPSPVDVIGLTGQAAGVAVGGNLSCALLRDGSVMCWGANYSGEIGDGTRNDRYTPVAVEGLPAGATAVAAGGGHGCAVVPEGVMCWGANNNHQLGTVISGSWLSMSPVAVAGFGSGVRQIATIFDHTCALTGEGGVVCWGFNERGQLGDGTALPQQEPVRVAGLEGGVISVAAGGYHSCAVTSAGAVKCWGDNSYGQLGDGTDTSSFLLVNVIQGADKAVRVVAGFYHTCYLTDTGIVKCWGLNTDGQLGEGTNTISRSPVQVRGLGKVLFLEAGESHTCAMLDVGVIKCWGRNSHGQLGNGNMGGSSNTPVDVLWKE
jgi:alpha-tubulin suppressor-like RCC1 family protein